ncbi:hypothetical protein AcW2_004128 [Taiwanofungus camphoratus]|nr:hypothetical protein AcW2_004128 [Antrodia cinnamomea]
MIDSWSVYLSPSPSTDSTSTRYSHLSVLSSSSSISSAASASIPSPLPSPSVSVASIGSKTHAFFGSPFDGSPTPLPPPNPPKRSISVKSQASTTSSFTTSDVDLGADETPRIEQHAPARSRNADFFGPSLLLTPLPTAAALPTSPSDSRETSPVAPATKHILPPLSRFFPSRRRYNTADDVLPSQPISSARRGFLELDTVARPHAYPGTPVYAETFSASPSDDSSDTPRLASDASSMPTPLPLPDEHRRTSYIASHADPKPAPLAPPPPSLPSPLEPGTVISSASLSLQLERVLGRGAFSSVWLARDVKGQLGALELSRRTSLLRSKSEKRGRARRIEGTRPKVNSHAKGRPNGERHGVPMVRTGANGVQGMYGSAKLREASDDSVYLDGHEVRADGTGGADGTHGHGATKVAGEAGRLVAVKMTERALCEKNARTRVSFVREVEILRHISHPSIVAYVHSFNTPSHHCLVLEHVDGGELFDLIDAPESHARLDEPLLRRMFGELCKAVGWMHGVGLVHRDIKLENILLTTSPFTTPLPPPPASLVKLSDFGLSRFIDPAQPLLTTLCGSESYAAPELVTGRPYDARETDAWACGVVLYALATRRLPFDPPRAKVPREEAAEAFTHAKDREVVRAERKALLVRIAKGEYAWPEDNAALDVDEEQDTLMGAALARSKGIRRIVERLLARDPRKRSKIIDLWEDEWMRGEGAPLAPPVSDSAESSMPDGSCPPDVAPEQETEDGPCLDADDDGVLVDGHDIGPGSVARQEH